MLILLFTFVAYLHTSNYGYPFTVPELRQKFTKYFVRPMEHSGDLHHVSLQNTKSKVQLPDTSSENFQLFDPEWDYTFLYKNLAVPNIIMDMYESLEEENSKSGNPKIDAIRCLRVSEYQSTTSGVVTQFNISNIQNKELIVGAELYIYRSPKSLPQHSAESSIIRLYQVQSNEGKRKGDSIQNADIHELLGVTYVSKHDQGWQKFKVQKSLEKWHNEELRLGFLIIVTDTWGNLIDPKYFGLEITHTSNSPMLVLRFRQPFSTNDFRHLTSFNNDAIQSKTISTSAETYQRNACARQFFSVSFAKEGYNFVIFPKSAILYKCGGSCRSIPNNNFTNHAKFLQILQKPNETYTESCCVPQQYSHLTIIFYDRFDNIIIKKYNNMVVESCACR